MADKKIGGNKCEAVCCFVASRRPGPPPGRPPCAGLRVEFLPMTKSEQTCARRDVFTAYNLGIHRGKFWVQKMSFTQDLAARAPPARGAVPNGETGIASLILIVESDSRNRRSDNHNQPGMLRKLQDYYAEPPAARLHGRRNTPTPRRLTASWTTRRSSKEVYYWFDIPCGMAGAKCDSKLLGAGRSWTTCTMC